MILYFIQYSLTYCYHYLFWCSNSQIWLVGTSPSWLLFTSDIFQASFQCFLAFWHDKTFWAHLVFFSHNLWITIFSRSLFNFLQKIVFRIRGLVSTWAHCYWSLVLELSEWKDPENIIFYISYDIFPGSFPWEHSNI